MGTFIFVALNSYHMVIWAESWMHVFLQNVYSLWVYDVVYDKVCRLSRVALSSALHLPVTCCLLVPVRCADSQDSQGRWNNYHDDVDHDGKSLDWGRWAITCNDHEFGGQGNPDTGGAGNTTSAGSNPSCF